MSHFKMIAATIATTLVVSGVLCGVMRKRKHGQKGRVRLALKLDSSGKNQKTTAVIREGVADDMPAVMRMVRELAAFEKEPNAVQNNERKLLEDGFNREHPLFRTLVIEESGGKLIGFALYFDIYSTWQGHSIYLEDLYVDPAYRSCGLGSRLLHEISKEAVSMGCCRVQWQVLDWNTSALKFYQGIGAIRMDSWLNMRLRDDALRSFAASSLDK